MTTSRSVVTGASGFVGSALLARLGPGASRISLGEVDWRERIGAAAFRDANVFHLAARVHHPATPDAQYHRDNVEKTVELAQAAARGGARRFIFLSSIKVNGEETRERPFRPDDPPAPGDAYARSKWNAEAALADISSRSGLAVVVVRSPLVVGRGAAGNLRALLRIASSPMPLPFAAVENRRTLVDVDDLGALLCAAAEASAAPGRVYFAGDPQPLSTPRLIALVRAAWARPPRLFRVRPDVLETFARAAGQGEKMRRLTRSLEADVTRTLSELEWAPATSLGAAITRMAIAYRERSGGA